MPPHIPHAHSSAPSTQDLRPRRLWYWVGAVVLAVGLTAGVALIALGANSAKPTPDFAAQVDGSGTATFEVGAGEDGQWALFTTDVNTWDCTHTTPSGKVGVLEREGSYETDDGVWILNGYLDTTEPGEHTYSCAGGSQIRHGIAGGDVVKGAETRRVAMVSIGLGLAAAGIVAALVIVVVTALRRRGNARRPAR
ncbi:hypothetical protein CLV63_10996 [Murinocardiopsis flavida]|uniref:Uncharacterized protein n=2 Tax=Murinocardiopsis flavida TaxID=645275 RepID=A0A2P8DIP2_9ACTN|nr:hypothetical protein CLV63_10996 [Murinocardiopsis flavida]